MSKAVAVDFDGVVAEYDGWEGIEQMGDPHRGIEAFLRGVKGEGLEVVIHTTRTNPDPFNEGEYRQDPEALGALVWGYLTEHGLDEYVDRVFTGTGKPIAVAYVDDRAVSCRPGDGRGTTEFGAAMEHIRSLL